MSEKEFTEETIRGPTNETSDEQESNSQKETPEVPIAASPPALTIESAGGIDPLYEAHLKGKIVEFPPWIQISSNGVEILPQELYIHISDTQNILSVKLGNSKGIVLYFYKDGYYKLWNDSDCRTFIKERLPRRIAKRMKYVDEVFKELRTEYANIKEEELNSDEKIINFRNGVLNIETGKLLPPDPKYICTIQIPCDYKKGLKLEDAPTANKFFHDITGGNEEDIATLLEIIGAVISNVKCSRFKKLLILKGAGNTGKSVLREFVIALVGLENSHTLEMKELHGKFGLGGIYQKRLIGSGELQFSRIPEIDKIKELTGGDRIRIENKYENAFTTQFRGFLWWNCNCLPNFGGDKGKHVYDRFLIVSCNNVIPPEERDSQLLEKLLAEKEIIVSVAIQHLQQAIARDYKFTESERTVKNREEYMIRNNSLALFLKECCIIGEGRTTTSLFREKYMQWCKENRFEPEKRNDIARILENDFGVVKAKSYSDYYVLTIKE